MWNMVALYTPQKADSTRNVFVWPAETEERWFQIYNGVEIGAKQLLDNQGERGPLELHNLCLPQPGSEIFTQKVPLRYGQL